MSSRKTFSSRAEFASWKFDLLDALFADPSLSHLAKVVAYCLLQHMNWKTGRCFPALEVISAWLDINIRSAKRAIRELKASGWIAITRRNRHSSNSYAFSEKNVGRMQKRLFTLREIRKAHKNMRFLVSEGTDLSPPEGTDLSPKHLKRTPKEPTIKIDTL